MVDSTNKSDKQDVIHYYALISSPSISKEIILPKRVGPFEISFTNKLSGPHGQTIDDNLRRWDERGTCPLSIYFTQKILTSKENPSPLIQSILGLLRIVKFHKAHLKFLFCFKNESLWYSSADPGRQPLIVNTVMTPITQQDIREVIKRYRQFTKIERNDKNSRIDKAIMLWEEAIHSNGFEVQLIFLYTALESILSTGKTELQHKLSLRVAWLLEPNNSKKRKEIYLIIKKGYDLRSEVVHGVKGLEKENIDMVMKIRELVRLLLYKLITSRKNVLDIFYSKKSDVLEIYLTNVTLHCKNIE